MHQPIDSLERVVTSTQGGKQAFDAVDTALKTYFDARAYVIATGLNQMNTRLGKAGVYENFGNSIGGALSTAGKASGYTPERVESISANLAKLSNSPTANKFIDAGQETVTQALNNPNVGNTVTTLNNINALDTSSHYLNPKLMRR
jgi:hypothetical protein